jgi:anti-sigma regulatory factor (Ser/Thr protein kinase)
LWGLYETADEAFLDRFVFYASNALYNARAYEHQQHVSLTFQNAAIGVTLPAIPGVVFDAVYEAGRAEEMVGGDWYDAFTLHDGRFVVSVGDVAGSGLSAAVTMVNVRQSLRGVAYVHADPVFMLRAAEETLRAQYRDRYVTAFVAVIDPVTQTCSYANAGHPPPLLRYEDGAVRPLLGRSLPLGMHDFDVDFEPNHISLTRGSMLVLYTDGITEATRDPVEGEQRLMRAVAALSADTPDIAKAIYAAVLPTHASDDVAILTMRFGAEPQLRRWRFDPRWADVAQRARQELLGEMAAGGFSEAERFFAEVIFSELVANLVRYAEGIAELILERRGCDLILHTIDKGPGFYFSPRLPSDLFSERGRGLFVISQLAKEFTVEHRPGGGSHARVVFKSEGVLE